MQAEYQLLCKPMNELHHPSFTLHLTDITPREHMQQTK